MKQHEFDKWVKQSVSDYEETADKVEWNKTKVFDSLMSMQNAPEKRKWKLSYSAAAIILALISINIFQFLQLNSETFLFLRQAKALFLHLHFAYL